MQSMKLLKCPKTVTFPSNEWPWRTIPLVYGDPKDFQLPVPTLSHEEQKRRNTLSVYTKPAFLRKRISDFLWKVPPNINSEMMRDERFEILKGF